MTWTRIDDDGLGHRSERLDELDSVAQGSWSSEHPSMGHDAKEAAENNRCQPKGCRAGYYLVDHGSTGLMMVSVLPVRVDQDIDIEQLH